MNTFDSDTEENNNNDDVIMSQKDGASNNNNNNNNNNDNSNEGDSSNNIDGTVKNSESQVQASQSMPSSIDEESNFRNMNDGDDMNGNRNQTRANAPSPGSENSRPNSPGFRLRDSPQNSPGRNDNYNGSSNVSSGMQGRRSASGRRSRSGSVTATPMSNISRSFATPGQNVMSSGGKSSIGSRTPLSQRGLRDRIPRGDLGHRSAVRSSASRRGRHGALPPISPALPTSGLGMVGPTPPSTPGSAILSEIRAVPQSALSQMSMSENNMGSGSSLNSSVGDVTSQAGNAEINHAVIWGTTINVNDAMSSFRRFLNEFRLPRENDNFDGMNNNNSSNNASTTSNTTRTFLNSNSISGTGGAAIAAAGTTTFTIPDDGYYHDRNFAFYTWRSIPGFSKFGSYVGNGNANGPFIETGFSPSWVMFKRVSGSVASWVIYDNARDPFNAAETMSIVESASADNIGNKMDWLSNGLKIKGTSGAYNGSSNTYIYMAFAVHPFAGTTPVTAR